MKIGNAFSLIGFILFVNACFGQTIYNNTTTTVVLSGSNASTVDIIIQRGALVKITGTLTMSPGKTITIEKGGFLFVDGGKITGIGNAINQLWGGIIVEGTSTGSQTEPTSYINNETNFRAYAPTMEHGTIRLASGTIERANRAITLGLPDFINRVTPITPKTGGGIVYAQNSWFIDNQIYSVGFGGYQTTADGSLINECEFSFTTRNLGSNTSCIFLIDEKEMFRIWGNVFKGVFNRQDYDGITAVNSGISVRDDWPNSKPFNFKDLRYGIQITNPNNTIINSAGFSGLKFVNMGSSAINIHGLDFAVVSHCSYEEDNNNHWGGPGRTPFYFDATAAVYFQANTGVCNKTPDPDDTRSFVRTTDLGSFASDVVQNEISGNFAYGVRTHNNNSGLQILCNEFVGTTEIDILVESGGIEKNQGLCLSFPLSVSEPAANTFSYTHKYLTSDIHQNPGTANITYYYNGTIVNGKEPQNFSNSVATTNIGCNLDVCTPRPWPLSAPDAYNGIYTVDGKIDTLTAANSSHTLDDEIEYMQHKRQRYQYALIDTLLKSGDTTELIDTLLLENSFFAKYVLAKIYLTQRDFLAISALIDSLPSLPGYDREIEIFGDYLALQSLAEQNHHNDSFCQTLRSAITAIAEDTVWIASKAKIWINCLNATRQITDPADTVLLVPTYTNGYVLPYPLIPSDSSVTTTPVTAYPNPITGSWLNVEIENNIGVGRTFAVAVLNGLGNPVVSGQLVVQANDTDTIALDVSTLSAGTYYLRVVTNNTIVNQQSIIK